MLLFGLFNYFHLWFLADLSCFIFLIQLFVIMLYSYGKILIASIKWYINRKKNK